jgi:hypothetical protein
MGDCAFSPSMLEQARGARILVTITVHFNPTRLEFLAEVLRSLASFPVAAMDVILVTNTFDDEELGLLRRLCDEVFPDGNTSIRSHGDLAHPFDLTWCHKAVIAKEFVTDNNDKYTHFIYLEDDIRLNFINFCYFVDFRARLPDQGILPSFLRVEYSTALNGFVSTDMVAPVNVNDQPHIDFGETWLVNPPNPYIACFILDTRLAAEYVRTRSFERGKSRAVSDMDVRERAAMGLCHENVPAPFQSRYVIPISKATGMALNCAWISHLPNNYAHDANISFGKIRMASLFVTTLGTAASVEAPTVVTGPENRGYGARGKVQRKGRNISNKVIEGLRWRLGLRR